jgi:hypothetical protein
MSLFNFLSFMRAEVLPRRAAKPDHIRLDGATTGGSRDVAGRFRHHGLVWVVHEDTHYEPLMIAYAAAEAGADPFVEEDTERGRCLTLTAELRARQQSPHKYLYIAASSGRTDRGRQPDPGLRFVLAPELGPTDGYRSGVWRGGAAVQLGRQWKLRLAAGVSCQSVQHGRCVVTETGRRCILGK